MNESEQYLRQSNATTKGELEIDYAKGIIYFHSGRDGTTRLRICRVPTPIPPGAQIDITLNDTVAVGYTEDYKPIARSEKSITIRLTSGQPFTFYVGHDYELITLVKGVERRARISRLGFLGDSQIGLQWNARPAAGTQRIVAEMILAAREVNSESGRRDDPMRYTTRKATARELSRYGLNLAGKPRETWLEP